MVLTKGSTLEGATLFGLSQVDRLQLFALFLKTKEREHLDLAVETETATLLLMMIKGGLMDEGEANALKVINYYGGLVKDEETYKVYRSKAKEFTSILEQGYRDRGAILDARRSWSWALVVAASAIGFGLLAYGEHHDRNETPMKEAKVRQGHHTKR